VQGELEAALTAAGRPEPLSVAGRTDAGVHALGQVASHPGAPVPAERLNAALPGDVAVLASEEAAQGFDARRDARSRTYRYRVLERPARPALERYRALHWRAPLDRTTLQSCAELVRGTHDFTAFTPTQTEHVRFERHVLHSEWTAQGNLLEYRIEADSFLRHMVRTLVGTMLGVAAGRKDPAAFAALLEGRPRSEAGDTAAAGGLYLESVSYAEPGRILDGS